MNIPIFILLLLWSLTLNSQSTYEVKSQISIPIELSFKTLEDLTNSSLPKELYKDTSYEDNENDQLKCSVYKNGAIKITPIKANLLKIDVPLKVWIAKGIGTLGYYNYQSTNFQMVMSFYMAYNIHSNWNLVTKTVKNGYTWVQKPTLNMKGVEIPITTLVEIILDKKQQSYADLIDNQIKKNIHIKKDVNTIWNQLSTPTLLSEEYKSWLVTKPLQINFLPLTQSNSALNLRFVIDLISSTYLKDSFSMSPITSDVPPFKLLKSSTEEFALYTAIHIPYDKASELARKTIVNKEFEFNDGAYRVRIQDIQISGVDSNIVIETLMTGSFNGRLTIKGHPYFDSLRNAIRLRDLDYSLKTRNILHKVASWLFEKKILNSLNDNFEIPLADNLSKAKLSTESALNQEKNGVKIAGTIKLMRPLTVNALDDKILLIISTIGTVKASM
jgi:hypothetical protein